MENPLGDARNTREYKRVICYLNVGIKISQFCVR